MYVLSSRKSFTPNNFADDKNVHQVILRSSGTSTSGYNQMKKIQRIHLRVNTKNLVTTQTVIDVKIKLM